MRYFIRSNFTATHYVFILVKILHEISSSSFYFQLLLKNFERQFIQKETEKEMSSSKQSAESEYEIAYRSTIQPRTAVRTQSRQSGNYSAGTMVGGGGGKAILENFMHLLVNYHKS